jgi:hypothetical protein
VRRDGSSRTRRRRTSSSASVRSGRNWPGIPTASRSCSQDAGPLPGLSRPERLQGAARRRGSQGLRSLYKTRSTSQAQGARPAARMVGRDHLGRRRTSEPDVARFEYGKAKQDDLIDYFKLTPANGRLGTGNGTARTAQVAAAAENPHRLRPAADRLRCAGRAGHVSRQTAARPQPAAGHRPHQPPAAGDEEAHRRGGGFLRRLRPIWRRRSTSTRASARKSLIDWEALKRLVPGEVERCMETRSRASPIADTRDCLLAALAGAQATRRRPHFRAQLQEPGTAVGGGFARSLPLPAPPSPTTGCAASTSPTAAAARQQGHATASCRPRPEADRGEHDLPRCRRGLPVFKIDADYVTQARRSCPRPPTRPRHWKPR